MGSSFMSKQWYKVRMTFSGIYFGEIHIYTHDDEVEGTSPADALLNARYNWDKAFDFELL